MAHLSPKTPACFLVSAGPGPLAARFSVGKVSLQRPCYASARAFSVVSVVAVLAGAVPDFGAWAMRDSTGKSIVAAKRKAILPGVSNMASQHATLLGSRQEINVRQR